jgi:hypothetical protein
VDSVALHGCAHATILVRGLLTNAARTKCQNEEVRPEPKKRPLMSFHATTATYGR